jgi:hypothetical protein
MKWDEMRGDERERFCAKCNRTVVNLSVLTEAQRVALLASAQPGQLCAAYRRRLSRATNSPAAPLRRTTVRTVLRLGAAAAYVATVAAVANNATQPDSAVSNASHAATNSFASMRYKVEDLIDDVRVFFGGTPRYMALGMVLPSKCLPPPTPVVAPTTVSPSVPAQPGAPPASGKSG